MFLYHGQQIRTIYQVYDINNTFYVQAGVNFLFLYIYDVVNGYM